jgi:AcrR family transcriptional regulator
MPDDKQHEEPTTPARRYFLRQVEGGLFTGARLEQIDPRRYAKVCELIAEGVLSRRQIADVTGTSPNTVRAIEESKIGSIDAVRARLAAMCSRIQGATLDRILEAVEDPDPANAPTLRDLSAILREVGARSDLLEGRPTSIVGHEAGSVSDMVSANAERRAQLRALKAKAELAEFKMTAPTLPEQGTRFRSENLPARPAEEADLDQVDGSQESAK